MEANTKKELFSWINTLIVTMSAFFFIQYFLTTSFMVSGESMEPTLENGDRMFVNKMGYSFKEPELFDVIIFHASSEEDYVKRIIGVPGDRIEYKGDVLYVNEEPMEEPFLEPFHDNLLTGMTTLTDDFTLEENTGYKEVPEDHVFVLGDNRRVSLDSRVIGFIPYEDIVGSASFVYWPLNEMKGF